eukprot:463302-Hanusia_phi.AAC.3
MSTYMLSACLAPYLLSLALLVQCSIGSSDGLAFNSNWLRTATPWLRAAACPSHRATRNDALHLQMAKKKDKKMQKVRVDTLLVERGLALHTKEVCNSNTSMRGS